MNARSFKVIFSKRLGALVAVGENATAQGKSASGEATHSASGLSSAASSAAQHVGVLKHICLAALMGSTTQAFALDANALPTGPELRHGAATVGTEGATMTINQSSSRATINWQSFNVGEKARVNVVQNDSQSVLLNRVVGNDMSQIRGQISANGQVVLVNPNGIVMGPTGRITASAFTASTFGITDANFQNGNMAFERNSSDGKVVHQGHIQTTEAGGYVALIGAEVSNEGTIQTRQGAVVLAAAERVSLPSVSDMNSVSVPLSHNVRLEIDPAAFGSASVSNSGVIQTEGGQVLLRAAAVVDAVSKVAAAKVSHTGSIDTTGEQGGRVDILADQGHVRVSGNVKANSTDGSAGGDVFIGRDEQTNVLAAVGDASGARIESKGGFVETSGEYLRTKGTRVLAKDWLLDPTDIKIVASDTGTTNTASSNVGGISGTTTFQDSTTTGASEVLKADIESAINAGTNVTISTTNGPGTGQGNITIETALNFNNTGDQDATLTLLAKNGITQNAGATITETGTDANRKLVHVVMLAEGLPGGVAIAAGTNNTSSRGITLNSTIKTNGDVTIKGTSANNTQHGVRFSNGSGIEARSYNVTGRMTANSGGNQGAAQGSGVVFTGTSAFKSTEDSRITGSTGSNGVFGVHFHNGSTVTFDTGGAKLVVATDEANMGGGVKIGWAGGAVINTKGDVTLGSLNTNAFTHVQGTVNASGNTVNQVGSLKLLGQSAGSNGGIASQDGGGAVAKVIATGNTTIDMEGVATGAAHGVNLGITLGSPISSERGKITIKGTTTTASGFNGVNVMNNTSITSASGDIHITGNSASNTNAAVRLNWGTVTTGGNIEVTGTSTTAGALGVWTDNAKVTGSNVTVSGTSVSAAGVHLGNGVNNSVNGLFEANGTAAGTGFLTVTGVSQSGTAVQSQSGTMKATKNIVIDALSNTGNGVVMTGTNGIQSTSGDVTIKADSLNLATTGVGITSTNGLVSIQNKTAGTLVNVGGNDVLTGSKTVGINNTELSKIAASKTAIGSTTAGDLTVSNAVTSLNATGDLSLISGGNIAINGVLTVGDDPATSGVLESTKNLTLNGIGTNSTITQNSSGVIKATGLELLGDNATHTLTNTGNSIANLAAHAKNVDYKNGVELTVGAVNSTVGITAKDGVSVTTELGNLNINESITNTMSGDVKVGAGASKGAGDSLGGDVKTTVDKKINNTAAGGKTLVYTGGVDGTGALKNLNDTFETLLIAGSQANTGFNRAFGSTLTSGPAAQVLFRQNTALPNVTGNLEQPLPPSQPSGVYNGKTIGENGGLAQLKEALKESNAGNFTTQPMGSSNTFGVAKADVIDLLDLDAASNNIKDVKRNSSTNAVEVHTLTLDTSATTGLSGFSFSAPQTVDFKINPKSASVTANPTNVTFNGTVQTQTATIQGFLTEEVSGVTVNGLRSESAVGTYASNVTVASSEPAFKPGNYDITYTNAALTIAPPSPNPEPFIPVPVTPAANPNVVVTVAAANNNFQLAGAEGQCSTDALEQCECEKATDTAGAAIEGIQVCYEQKGRLN